MAVWSCFLSSLFLSYFFFSSRRRHTRFSRDWSSDVCSSDLMLIVGGPAHDDVVRPHPVGNIISIEGSCIGDAFKIGRASCRERCRGWWSRWHEKRKRSQVGWRGECEARHVIRL